jgi:hypothetical protein
MASVVTVRQKLRSKGEIQQAVIRTIEAMVVGEEEVVVVVVEVVMGARVSVSEEGKGQTRNEKSNLSRRGKDGLMGQPRWGLSWKATRGKNRRPISRRHRCQDNTRQHMTTHDNTRQHKTTQQHNTTRKRKEKTL